jgi:hypothetical protein
MYTYLQGDFYVSPPTITPVISGGAGQNPVPTFTFTNNSNYTIKDLQIGLFDPDGCLTTANVHWKTEKRLDPNNPQLMITYEDWQDILNRIQVNTLDASVFGEVAPHSSKPFTVGLIFSASAVVGVHSAEWKINATIIDMGGNETKVSLLSIPTSINVTSGVSAPVVTPPPATQLPWYMNLGGLFGDFGAWIQSGANSIVTGLQSNINNLALSVNAGFANLWAGFISSISGIFSAFIVEIIKQNLKAVREASAHSSPEKTEIENAIRAATQASLATGEGAKATAILGANVFSPQDGALELNKVAVEAALGRLNGGVIGALIEFWTAGQVEGVQNLISDLSQMYGYDALVQQSSAIPWDWLFYRNANHFYASKFTPEIPPYTDLINMRVKEKITQPEFETNLAFQGYNKYWAGKIWDAHFIAPTLMDILTAWRRGLINESRVDELMVLVDLDPFYKTEFDTRKYVDPPVSMARWMFETGAIGEDRVKEIVHRAGYSDVDSVNVVNFITKFQERRYRTRLLTALMSGKMYGAYTDADIRTEVKNLGQTDTVANLIIQIAEVRGKTEAARITRPKPHLLSLGDLKRGYMHNKISQDVLRIELLNRGYELLQIDLLVGVMEADKVVTDAGGKKVALTVAELKQAFQYSEITEDVLRQTLLLRGLDLSEVDMLIKTWKKSWGVSA